MHLKIHYNGKKLLLIQLYEVIDVNFRKNQIFQDNIFLEILLNIGGPQ